MLVSTSEFERQQYFNEDVHSTMTKIAPYLIRMLLDLTNNEKQEVQIAALRGIEFLLEKLGCTLDNYMIDILRAIVVIYPNKKAMENGSEALSQSPSESVIPITKNEAKDSKQLRKETKSQDFSKINEKGIKGTVIRNKSALECSFKAIKKLIQAMLDKYVSVLSSISSNILHQIFFDLLIKTLSDNNVTSELRILLIKIAEKIISICQGDLVLSKK